VGRRAQSVTTVNLSLRPAVVRPDPGGRQRLTSRPTQPSRSRRRAYCCEALEWATLIASLVTAAAVGGSVLFLARQTSQSVEQFLVANELAGARALAQGYELWDHVINRFIDYPELRQYFYEGVEPPEDPIAKARVLAMTELIGDALQSGDWLYQGKDVALLGAVDLASDIRTDWDDWTQFILTMSPALRSFVRERPLQYPFLTRMLHTIESATTGRDGDHRIDKMATADLP
jgi:hypothetical protein